MSHWLDGLAVETTRRQGLKAAAGALLMAMPFGRAQRAQASHPSSDGCQRGCLWTADGTYRRSRGVCDSQLARSKYGGILSALYFPGPGLVTQAVEHVQITACYEHALLQKKATSYDCLQPGCPGFDPDAPGGPCEPCTQTPRCKCCTDPASPIGYTYYDVDHPCPN